MRVFLSDDVQDALEDLESVLNEVHSSVLYSICEDFDITYIPENESKNIQNILIAVTTKDVDDEEDVFANIDTVLDTCANTKVSSKTAADSDAQDIFEHNSIVKKIISVLGRPKTLHYDFPAAIVDWSGDGYSLNMNGYFHRLDFKTDSVRILYKWDTKTLYVTVLPEESKEPNTSLDDFLSLLKEKI